MIQMLGAARREDVLGQSLLQLIEPDQRDICAAELGRAVADMAAVSQFETVFCTPLAPLSRPKSISGISYGTTSR
jgi:hypothetical protein